MNIASTLLWILGIINFIGGISLGIPQIARSKSVALPVYIFFIGIAACIAGYSLRKKYRFARILAIVVSVLSFVAPPLIGLIIGIVVIVLVLINWKKLNQKV